MKPTLKLNWRGLAFAASLLLLAAAGTASVAQRTALTSGDLPFYARLERGLIHTDGQWAAIAFYRPPECVRPDFNLLDFFDVPAVFGCNSPEPYLVGFGIWKNVPAGVPPLESGIPPIQSNLQLAPNQSMPIWFVSWQELEVAIADDVLTLGELAGLSSLQVGTATYYTETLHPLGAAQQPVLSLVALGFLEDGRSFEYLAIETHEVLRQVKIEFK